MPNDLILTEPVLDAAIAKLKAGMAARIGAINAATGDDDVQVGTPLEQDYYLGGVAAIPGGRCPAIIVTDGGSGENGGFQEEGAHSLTYLLELVVFILDEDSDRGRLARKLLRLERAVIEVLWDDDPREFLVISDTDRPYITPQRIQPGPVFDPEREGQPYRQWRAVVFEVRKYETT